MLAEGDICPLQIVPLDFFRRDELRSLTVASVTPRLGIPCPVQFLAAALWWRPGQSCEFPNGNRVLGPRPTCFRILSERDSSSRYLVHVKRMLRMGEKRD